MGKRGWLPGTNWPGLISVENLGSLGSEGELM